MITTAPDTGDATIEAHVTARSGRERWLKGQGNGPIAAFVDAAPADAGIAVEITDYSEHALSEAPTRGRPRTSRRASAAGRAGASGLDAKHHDRVRARGGERGQSRLTRSVARRPRGG